MVLGTLDVLKADFFNLYYNESNKAIFQIIENFFKMIEKTGKNIKEIK